MAHNLTFEEKYKVLGTKNKKYDGIYFTAVKTTGIFCHPSCRARIPKAKNVVFYSTIQEALENGYRPCKICKPHEKIGETPTKIKQIIDELLQNPQIKISDQNLKDKGIEPNTIRRWFNSNYGMTFHAFQRLNRINSALKKIKKGKTITQSAFESGYDSISGFNESFKSIFNNTAKQTKSNNIINVSQFSSPIGKMIACSSDKGICFLGFIGQKRLEENLESLKKDLNAKLLPGKSKHLTLVKKEITQYFDGILKSFTVNLDIIGTEFQKQTWNELIKIPYGNTISYKQQSISMKNPKAIRAIASANGANRISIIIPCHRVIGSNGSLTGYAGGIYKKSWLINFEKKNSNQVFQPTLLL